MRARSSASVVAYMALLVAPTVQAAEHTLIVAGLGGEAEYESRFVAQAEALADFARQTHGAERTAVLHGAEASAGNVKRAFESLAARARPDDVATIVLIGHGSFDGEEYRFNVPGPDLTGTELAALFDRVPARRQLIVNATSASGAVVERWARPERIVISATKSGGERTATRFAQHWLRAVTTPAADVNKDDLITAVEAFEFAQRQVEAAFKADASLATEHSRLQGEGAEQFAVARFGVARTSGGDPQIASLLNRRGALELELNAVKARKAALSADAYYDELEGVLVRMAVLQQQIDARQATLGASGGET